MDPQAAVDTPAFVGWSTGRVEENTFEPKLLGKLSEMGVKVEIVSPKQAAIARGYWAGAKIDATTRRIKGGVTRGMDGGVVAY